MTKLTRRLEIAEAKAAAINPASTMPLADLKARLAEVRARLCAAWGLPADADHGLFVTRLASENHPLAAKALTVTRNLISQGAL